MFSSKIQLECPENEIESYYNALHPEEKSESERASYKLKKEKNKLTIEIKAEDATAFRAVTNTLLGLISVIEKTLKGVKNG
jgi:tRNA threonylcarbamoyladenosine modification (KEOPS) complex  Pcc1 subunit